MSRVLATTELELRDQLLRAGDLDQLIAVHQAYINRIYDRQVFVTNLRGSCATESMTGRYVFAAAAQQNLWQAGVRGSCASESMTGRCTRQLRK